MGSYRPCSRRHCGHDRDEWHRKAQDGKGGVLYGACHKPRCMCSQYVEEGLVTGNRVLGIGGDTGLSSLPRR